MFQGARTANYRGAERQEDRGGRVGFAAIGAETEEESLGGGVASVPFCQNRTPENLLSVC